MQRTNALAVVGSVLTRTGEKDRLILVNTRPQSKQNKQELNNFA
ncbi:MULTISPECIES: hypothetical protein [unclassified Psychrobacter]